MSQENVEIVRMAYAAISVPDFDALTKVTDPKWVFDYSRAIGPQKGSIEATKKSLGSQPAPKKLREVPTFADRIPDAMLLWELRDGKVVKTTLYNSRAEALEAAGLRD